MKKYKSLIIGTIITVLSFVLVYTGMMVVSGRDISDNILPYAVSSIILGLIMAAFHHYKFKYAFYILLVGTIVGFFEMFRNFMSNLSGWEDLAGIVSLMFWIAAGFFAGIIAQGISYLYKRYKK